jgi:hypothetical protein
MPTESLFPDHVHFKVPEGMLAQVHRVARSEGMRASEWLRQLVREGLAESAEGGSDD